MLIGKIWLSGSISLLCLVTPSLTQAQITPDATLGAESSVITPNISINGLPSDQINGGARQGTNLFHSFAQFNIDAGAGAYFTNPVGIENIISRVTGGSLSNIRGTLGVLGNANLFLINPNGILFGPNASLNINGSFIASTASSLNFADGNQFSATSSDSTTPILTISVPIGLQFGGNASSIQVEGNGQGIRTTTDLIDTTVGLRVQPNRTLALVGGNVALEGGTLKTAGGRIELGSVVSPSLVSLTPIDKGWALGYEGVPTFGDIQLSGVASVDASGEGGGDVQVWGRQVTIQGGSVIEASTLSAGPGGTLAVRASDLVELSGRSANSRSGLFAQVYPGASGAGGNLTVETGQFTARDGARLSTDTGGTGAGGNLTVTADAVELNQSNLLAQVGRNATGAGGNLTVETGRLTVQNGAQVSTSTSSTGAGGNLTVTADAVELNQSNLLAQVGRNATGAGGNLSVKTRQLTVRDRAQVSTTTSGTGPGGNLEIAAEQLIVQNGGQVQATTSGVGQAGNLLVRASDSVELIRDLENGPPTGLYTTVVNSGTTGTGGNLSIETRRLSVQNGAQIQAATRGAARGGILTINASDSVELNGALPTATPLSGSSGLFVSAEPTATGSVGVLSITTGQLIVQNGAKISADNFGTGEGGTATMNVRQLIVRDGGLVRAASFDEGPGGTLTVNASESVQVSGTGTIGPDRVNSTLFVSSTGSGNAGDLQVTAPSIYLDNQAALSADTTAGQGNIILHSRNLLVLRRSSNITTNATRTATGGNIIIESGIIAATENSDISANAEEAFGGRITINAQGIFGIKFREAKTSESDITATSNLGPQFSGTVTINTPDADPSRGLVALPTNLVDASGLIAQSCRGGGRAIASEQNQFIVTGRGGLPPSPSDALSTQAVWQDLRPPARQVVESSSSEVNSSQSDVKRTPDPSSPIVEAQGWVISPNGQVILTAQAPTVTPYGFVC